jgi:hypothetical protein
MMTKMAKTVKKISAVIRRDLESENVFLKDQGQSNSIPVVAEQKAEGGYFLKIKKRRSAHRLYRPNGPP